MSSKFNIHPRPMLRPSICKAPHGSCWPPWPINEPLICQAYLTLFDLDPLDPISGTGYAVLPKLDPAPTWAGISPEAATRVGAVITAAGAANLWNVTATLYPPAHAPASWFWSGVYIDPTKSFDTGLLKRTIIPGQDFQLVRITG